MPGPAKVPVHACRPTATQIGNPESRMSCGLAFRARFYGSWKFGRNYETEVRSRPLRPQDAGRTLLVLIGVLVPVISKRLPAERCPPIANTFLRRGVDCRLQ